MRKKLLTTLVTTLVLVYGALAVVLATGTRAALGLDLQGGISVTKQPRGTDYSSAGLDLTVERLRERVDSLGVAEPEILRQGETIVINLPGVKDQQQAIEQTNISGKVLLRPVLGCQVLPPTTGAATPDSTGASGDSTPGTGGAPAGTGGAPAGTGASTPATVTASTTASSATPSGFMSSRAVARRSAPATTPDTTPATVPVSVPVTAPVGGSTPDSTPGTTPAEGTATLDSTPVVPTSPSEWPPSDPTATEVRPVRASAEVGEGSLCQVGPAGGTGEVFEEDATARLQTGEGWVVDVSLRGGDGEATWNALAAQCYSQTEACPSRQLAIELDGEIVSYPSVNEPEFQGTVQISGSFTEGDAKTLARVLQSGALPVELVTVAVQNVSPTLGKDSLHAALIAGLVGVGLVLAMMVLYYRHLGLLAIAGLTVSGSILWVIISLLSRTQGLALSLAGVAGIIVSVGVTVDSYVVFFERLKDEVRAGRTMRNSAQRGFAGAWHTIVMADLVSLIGALVLWYLTVGSVRNFAFFLGLSTLIDLVVAWFFTRPAVLLLARTKWMARRKVMGIQVSNTAVAGAGGGS